MKVEMSTAVVSNSWVTPQTVVSIGTLSMEFADDMVAISSSGIFLPSVEPGLLHCRADSTV